MSSAGPRHDKLDISVSNEKYITDHFLSLAIKYELECLTLMLETGAGANKYLGR